MEEIIVQVVRDLPSTAVLILFVYMTNKQFRVAMAMMSEHLADINKILESCLAARNVDHMEKTLEVKISEVDKLLSQIERGDVIKRMSRRDREENHG